MEKVRSARSRRRVVIIAGVLIAVLAAAGGTAFVLSRPTSQEAVAAALTTTTVQETDLADSRLFSGTLGFGSARTVKSAGTGTITSLPDVGDTIAQGTPLYRVDDVPIPVFFGTTPLFRALGDWGLKGADVALVADNLAALGFPTGIDTSDPAAIWTWQASAAVKRWQAAAGLEPTGTLDVGQAIVLPGAARVNSVTAQLGDAVGGELLTVTATEKVVAVSVKATEITKIAVDAEVTIVLPDNTMVPGKVTAIATVVGDTDGDSPADTAPTLTVTIAPSTVDALAAFDHASVRVEVTTQTRIGVLAVPIGALVALQEGGYALQLPDGTYLAVTTGMFSRSLVEVSGEGITDGLTVVTAQ